jgi:hypothetical protein
MVEWSKRQYVRMEELNQDGMRHAVCMRMINATKSQYRKAQESSDTRHENENNMCAGMRLTVSMCQAEKAVRRKCQHWRLTIARWHKTPTKETWGRGIALYKCKATTLLCRVEWVHAEAPIGNYHNLDCKQKDIDCHMREMRIKRQVWSLRMK